MLYCLTSHSAAVVVAAPPPLAGETTQRRTRGHSDEKECSNLLVGRYVGGRWSLPTHERAHQDALSWWKIIAPQVFAINFDTCLPFLNTRSHCRAVDGNEA